MKVELRAALNMMKPSPTSGKFLKITLEKLDSFVKCLAKASRSFVNKLLSIEGFPRGIKENFELLQSTNKVIFVKIIRWFIGEFQSINCAV